MSISNCGHDERWAYHGGKAGDNNGTEWQIVNWYSYPWNVMLRYPDAKVRHWMGDQARAAALNNHIGYDQYQRQTFWANLADSDYDVSKITVDCETDCSAGVLAIAKAAGYHFGISALKNINQNGYTGNEEAILTGAGFKAYRDSKYLTSGEYLDNGDILLNTVNHTAFNIDAGSKCDASKETAPSSSNMTRLTVIDVSEHQGDINWEKVSKQIDAAILRVTVQKSDGTIREDNFFKKNADACEKYGIPYGVYLYSLATTKANSKAENKAVLKSIKGRKITYPVFIDREERGNTGAIAINQFYNDIKSAGYTPGLYSGLYFYKAHFNGIKTDSLWIAAYGTNNGLPQEKYKPDFNIDGWQYSSTATMSGINGNVDISYFYKDYAKNSGKPTDKDTSDKDTKKPTPTITYGIQTDSAILKDVKNGKEAGNGNKIVGIKIGVDYGSIKYRVHCGGRWLSAVTGNNWNDYNNGYAGDGKNAIDAIQIYYTSDRNKTDVYEVVYSSKPIGYKSYLGEIHDTDWKNSDGNTTSGIFNKPIGYIKMSLKKV